MLKRDFDGALASALLAPEPCLNLIERAMVEFRLLEQVPDRLITGMTATLARNLF
ncbi:MAG: hypothetical protein FWD08_06060 [Alphaproteobacteria bacterium]|nr:hypothetical protein [Alphaproteobacteria bacterium]